MQRSPFVPPGADDLEDFDDPDLCPPPVVLAVGLLLLVGALGALGWWWRTDGGAGVPRPFAFGLVAGALLWRRHVWGLQIGRVLAWLGCFGSVGLAAMFLSVLWRDPERTRWVVFTLELDRSRFATLIVAVAAILLVIFVHLVLALRDPRTARWVGRGSGGRAGDRVGEGVGQGVDSAEGVEG